MGIVGLLPFLKKYEALEAFTSWPDGSVIAVDVPIFAHKFIYSEKTYEGLERKMISFARGLVAKKCRPIFVFDGQKLGLKENEHKKRAIARSKQIERQQVRTTEALEMALDAAGAILDFAFQSETSFQGIMFPTREDYNKLKLALEAQGHETQTALFEAEALCAHLTKTIAWATLTEDTDALAFGSERVIFKWSSEPLLAIRNRVLECLRLTSDQFTELCCLFGCDFCSNVYQIGPVNSYKLLLKYGSWASIFDAEKYSWPPRTLRSANEFNEKILDIKECFHTRAFEYEDPIVSEFKNIFNTVFDQYKF